MDFFFDPSLVLYLPLYRFDGASVASKDAYGHAATVTGALWTPQGYRFDGTDDYINCGSGASLDDLTVKTLIVWFKANGWGESAGGRLVQKASINADGWQLLLQNGTNQRLYYGQDWNNGTLASWVTPTGSIALGVWYCAAVVYDLSLATNDPLFYLNGVGQGVTEIAAPAGTADSDAANNLWIGARNNGGTPDREFNGLIGEVGLYRRGLSPLAIQRHFLSTKWRYR